MSAAPPTAPFSEVESRPWAEIEALQLQRLRTQLDYLAANSTFYQRKFAAAGVDARGHPQPGRPAAHPLHHQAGTAGQPAGRAAAGPAPGRAAGRHRAGAGVLRHHRQPGLRGAHPRRPRELGRDDGPRPVRERHPPGRHGAARLFDEQGVRRRRADLPGHRAHRRGGHPDRRRRRRGPAADRGARRPAALHRRHAQLPAVPGPGRARPDRHEGRGHRRAAPGGRAASRAAASPRSAKACSRTGARCAAR